MRESKNGAPLHICLIGPVPPPWGGVQTHMMQLRGRIRSAGLRCSMLNHSRNRQADHDDIYYPKSASDFWNRLKTLRPDIIHIHLGGSLFFRELTLFVALAARFPSRHVLTFHSGGYPSSDEGRAAKAWSYRGLALRSLDAVIGVNAELIQVFRRYGVSERKLHLIPPFAHDVERETVLQEALPPELADFRAKHSPMLLAVGLLEAEYGLDVQLEAFAAVRESHPKAGLVIIGSGTLHQTLRDQIARHPFGAHILLAGDVPRPKTLAAILQADLLLRTTHYDGDALSVREALSLGTPVLATDNGMRPEGVRLLTKLDAPSLALGIAAALQVARDGTSNGSAASGDEPLKAGVRSGVSPASPAPSPDPMQQVLELYKGVTTKF